MKYIKQYETFEDEKFDKYLVFKFPYNLIIAEFIKKKTIYSNDTIVVKRLYRYDISGTLKPLDGDKVEVSNDFSEKRLIYQSDDLQHTLDIADTLFDINKYNL